MGRHRVSGGGEVGIRRKKKRSSCKTLKKEKKKTSTLFNFKLQTCERAYSLEAGLDVKYFIILLCMDGIRQQHKTATFNAMIPRKHPFGNSGLQLTRGQLFERAQCEFVLQATSDCLLSLCKAAPEVIQHRHKEDELSLEAG